jgi:YggT family protein
VRVILQSLSRLHEPLLSRIRSVLPELGGIDLSPIIVFLAVQFLRNLMLEYTQ